MANPFLIPPACLSVGSACLFKAVFQKPHLGHTPVISFFPDYDMIHDRNPQEFPRLRQPAGKLPVLAAGLAAPGRMVMDTDHICPVIQDRMFKDAPYINLAAV